MRRQTYRPTGRRGTVIVASAAVLCLGGTLAACGNGAGDDGYVAVGAAGAGPAEAPKEAGLPSGKVTLIPMDSPGAESDGDGSGKDGARTDGTGTATDDGLPGVPDGAPGAGGRTATTGPGSGTGGSEPGRGSSGSTGGTGGTGSAEPGSAGGSGGTGGTGSAPPPSGSPGPTAPATPAALQVGDPVPADADERWCEKVTVEFRNTGGSPVRSGTATFETHVIGALGVDWATVESTQPLPAPIDAGAVRKKTYTVCVDAWRVPLGMRIETQDVTAVWK